MSKLKIVLLRERKMPGDNRVPLTPAQCVAAMQQFPDLDISVEPSPVRCFSDDEYIQVGIPLTEDLSDCDILMCIKEIPVEYLVEGKTYYFFSHTIKQQPHNRQLMQGLLEHRVTMVDYECFTDDKGARTIGFGHYAGIVGAHNGLLAYGQRTAAYTLTPAHRQQGYDAVLKEYKTVTIPPVKIAVTGSGRVAHGVIEHLTNIGIKQVSSADYLTKQYNEPVYVWLKGEDLYRDRLTHTYNREAYHQHPEFFESVFGPYTTCTDIMMNAVYWDTNAPVFFTKADMRNPNFHIKVVADITCDVNGSVPCTTQDTTINDPVYGYDPLTEQPMLPYQPNSIDVMAVSNLPNELPRESSQEFGESIMKTILPELQNTNSEVVGRATLCIHGHLTPRYAYLKEYAEGVSNSVDVKE